MTEQSATSWQEDIVRTQEGEKVLHQLCGILRDLHDVSERIQAAQHEKDQRRYVFGSLGEHRAYCALRERLQDHLETLYQIKSNLQEEANATLEASGDLLPLRVLIRVDTEYVIIWGRGWANCAEIVSAERVAEVITELKGGYNG